jgi:Tol biopolymer transport system component
LPAWSWDNHYLLFSGVPPAPAKARFSAEKGVVVGGGLVVVSVSDGKSREVLRREDSVDRGAFSPDGRFIAFSEGAPTAGTGRTFVVPVQGGEPRLISGEASLLDWTQDGRYLAVSSKRSHSAALWLLPVKDGEPSGDPVFVRNGGFTTGDIFPNEALLYRLVPTVAGGGTLVALDSGGHFAFTWETGLLENFEPKAPATR